VEVAECSRDGITTSWGDTIPPSQVRAQDVNDPRPRLGWTTLPAGDHWFKYGARSYEPGSNTVQSQAHYEAVAEEVLRLIDLQAEPRSGSNASYHRARAPTPS
jgi:uncharacterized protein (DUF2237 family)